MSVDLCIKISRYLNFQGWLVLAAAVMTFVFSLSGGVGPAPFIVVIMCGYLHFTASQVFVMTGKHLLGQRSVKADGDTLIAKNKALVTLCQDMLSTFSYDDVIVTEERVEAWRKIYEDNGVGS